MFLSDYNYYTITYCRIGNQTSGSDLRRAIALARHRAPKCCTRRVIFSAPWSTHKQTRSKESDFSLSYSSLCPPKESDLSLSCHFQNLSTAKHRRMRRGGRGGSCPPKFGQTVGEIRANSGWNSGKARRKKSARESYKLTPLECWWWRHTGNVQGGGCLWMSKSRGVFQILGGWMTSRGQCPRGGGVLVVICVKFRANQPLCPP